MSKGDPHENPFPPLPERGAGEGASASKERPARARVSLGKQTRGGDSGGAGALQGPTDVSDETLMMCVQSGELTSLQELMLRYERPLYGFLARYTGDGHLAEDLFQDCFVRLVQVRDAFEAGRGFRPWLYSIAANLARDACRRREVRSREEGRQRLAARERSSRSEALRPDQEAERHEEAEIVREVLDELPGDARAMVLLHFFQGLTYGEVAAALGAPVGTVKSRVHWAVQKLMAKWNERAAAGASVSRRHR